MGNVGEYAGLLTPAFWRESGSGTKWYKSLYVSSTWDILFLDRLQSLAKSTA
jgi:hypothetical protein